MKHFDDVANDIVRSFLVEGVTESDIVKIRVPGAGIYSIKARHLKTEDGVSIYMADEDGEAGNIRSGQDITELVVPDDEDTKPKKEFVPEDEESETHEENAEDPDLKGLGLDGKSLAAVNVAGKMATKAQGGLFNDPQKKMNKAYGDLMNKISTKISTVASKIA